LIMGKKVKRYEEGGVTEGPNVNIDDDTRARAMAWAARQAAGGDGEESAPEVAPSLPAPARRAVKRAAAKPARTYAAPLAESLDEGSTARRPSMTAPAVKAISDAVRSGGGFRGATGVGAGDVRGRGLRGLGGGTSVPGMKKGGSVSSASKRADGIASKGKTKGRII
jgi:hypothetical protein